MGIGRREFMRLFGGTLASITADPSSAVAILDDLYVNRKLGIAFRKPFGWSFADVMEMGRVQAGQILDLEDTELARQLVESKERPILTISKDTLSAKAKRFTPGVTIFLDRFDELDAALPGAELKLPPIENLNQDIESCRLILKDFRIVSDPVPRRVSECDAAEYHASFVFEHENMRPTEVRMRSLVICQGPKFYTLRMYDSLDEPDCRFDYGPFVDSVRMV